MSKKRLKRQMHVLVVDDDQYLLDGLNKIVEEVLPDAYVQNATSLSHALSLIGKHDFDLVITDLRLNQADNIDGIELASQFRKDDKSSPVVVITSHLIESLAYPIFDECVRLNLKLLARTDFVIFENLLRLEIKVARKMFTATKGSNSIDSMWNQIQLRMPISYWIVLLADISSSQDRKIAGDILWWQEFSSGGEAELVLCLQGTPKFNLVTEELKTPDFPALIFSNDPNMQPYVSISGDLLKQLCSEESDLKNFVAKIHNELRNESNIRLIHTRMHAEKYWKGFLHGMKHFKEFSSFVKLLN